jgi:hypothetical protein
VRARHFQQVRRVLQRLLGACGRDFLLPYQAAQDLCDFDVQQLRDVHLFRSRKSPLHQHVNMPGHRGLYAAVTLVEGVIDEAYFLQTAALQVGQGLRHS